MQVFDNGRVCAKTRVWKMDDLVGTGLALVH